MLVPGVFAGEKIAPEAHILLFLLSVLAMVPLAALLSHVTESVAAKTGDTVGGLLNATLGNLTELVIALAALRAGQYALVKASIAGTIVANTLFMLGASFLLGGIKHHVQEFNRSNARLQAGLLFLATVALLIPSAVAETGSAPAAALVQQLSLGLSVLLIMAYGLGLVFTLKTHRDIFGSTEHGEGDEGFVQSTPPDGLIGRCRPNFWSPRSTASSRRPRRRSPGSRATSPRTTRTARRSRRSGCPSTGP